MTFTAAFRGECPDCGGSVKGHECDFNAYNEVVHVTCPPSGVELQRPVCPTCSLELPVSLVCGNCD